MSVKVMSHVWEFSKHKGSDLLTLLAIADHADDEGNAYPSIARLAKKTRMSQRNVQYVLKKLEQSSELDLHRDQGPNGCHLFHVRLGGVKTLHPEKIAPLKSLQGATGFRGGVKSSVTALKNARVVLREPSLEPSLKTPLSPPKGKIARRVKHGLPNTQEELAALKASVFTTQLTEWCAKKGLAFDLESQWDAFTRKARANGYKYLDWYCAFQNWLDSPYQTTKPNAGVGARDLDSDDFLKSFTPEGIRQ